MSAVGARGPASIGCQALVLARVFEVFAGPEPKDYLQQVPELPIAWSLMENLAKIGVYGERKLIEEVATSRAALALGKDPANGGKGGANWWKQVSRAGAALVPATNRIERLWGGSHQEEAGMSPAVPSKKRGRGDRANEAVE